MTANLNTITNTPHNAKGVTREPPGAPIKTTSIRPLKDASKVQKSTPTNDARSTNPTCTSGKLRNCSGHSRRKFPKSQPQQKLFLQPQTKYLWKTISHQQKGIIHKAIGVLTAKPAGKSKLECSKIVDSLELAL